MPGNLYLREPLEILGTGGADRPDTVGGLHAPQPQAYGTTTTKLLGRKTAIPQPAAQPPQSQVKGWERQTLPRTTATATTNPQRGESRGRYIIHNQQCSWKRTKRSLKATRSQLSRPRVPAAVLGSLPPLGAARLPAPTPAAVPSGGGQAAAGHPLMLLFCSQSS